MRALLTALALTVSAMSADAAFRCALPPQRCAIVYDELRAYFLAEERDEYLYQNVKPFPRRRIINQRSHDRLVRRLKALDKDVGNELGRLLVCDVLDRSAAMFGGSNTDPRCADQQ